MDQLSEEVRQESPWTMMFADDIVICSESREQVEENLERWRFALERRGMKVSRSKTEYMCVNEREGSGTVRLQGEEVKKVQEFKYLGSTVQSNGECGKEVKKRVQAGWNGWRKVSGVLCDRKISARIKGKVYRTVVRPAMLYGLETVSLRKRQESELEVAELKMLRHPKQMPEPPQLPPFDVEEQRLYSELLPGDRAPYPISKGAPCHPKEEAHFGRLYPGSYPFGHDPELMAIVVFNELSFLVLMADSTEWHSVRRGRGGARKGKLSQPEKPQADDSVDRDRDRDRDRRRITEAMFGLTDVSSRKRCNIRHRPVGRIFILSVATCHMYIYLSRSCSNELRCEDFWPEWKEIISGCLVDTVDKTVEGTDGFMECVCYGLGNFSSSVSARYQLAMLLLLLDALQIAVGCCSLYDPVFTVSECETLRELGFTVLSENEEGKRAVHRPTLFYLMHCGKALYNNLLWKNWSPQILPKVIVLGNSFLGIQERYVALTHKPDSQTECMYSKPRNESLHRLLVNRQLQHLEPEIFLVDLIF
ncbi:hypothetical protein QTP70_034304 [Hemibagrus guttatus]|uniref:ribonuclease H n=1 Tax=Hemibagrus guttatus TaxID=175788 RepID=A0AAE0R2S5_9TELE|nr:hypothetical protein QTP70_034304 [Hemibagrus guttatus]